MSTKVSGKYQPGISTTGKIQELYQIYYNDEELHGDLGDGDRMPLMSSRAAVFGSGDGTMSKALDRLDLKREDTDEIELYNDMKNDRKRRKSNQEAYHMSLRPMETEIRAIPKGSNGNGCTYSTMTVSTDTFSTNAKPDSTTPILSGGQSRILIRRDSDLGLVLPPQSHRVGALRKKARECCSECTRWPTWRKVLCVALLVIAAILLYVVIMVAIVKGIGG